MDTDLARERARRIVEKPLEAALKTAADDLRRLADHLDEMRKRVDQVHRPNDSVDPGTATQLAAEAVGTIARAQNSAVLQAIVRTAGDFDAAVGHPTT